MIHPIIPASRQSPSIYYSRTSDVSQRTWAEEFIRRQNWDIRRSFDLVIAVILRIFTEQNDSNVK
jgi:hypothetical protein